VNNFKVTVQTITLDQLLQNLVKVLRLCLLNGAVYYIRGAFLHAKLVDFTKELRNEILADLFVPKLKSLLESIVPVGVLS
jgi:hypothetical protein